MKHQKQILQYATKPDQRRYAVANEAAKHFIDLDLYPDSLSPVMKSYTEIIHLMGDSFVHKHGIGP